MRPLVPLCHRLLLKNIRRTKRRHAQLLDVLRRPPGRAEPVTEPDLRAPRPGSSRPAAAPASAPDKWLRTPTGWTSIPEAYQLPASSQCGLPSCPTPSSRQSFTMGDTMPSASVGFLAAAGTSRVTKSLYPTGLGLSWSSGSRGSPSLTPRPTPSSAGLRGPLIPSVSPPGRLPVRPPLSPLPPSATVLPVPSHARVLAGPLTQTASSPLSPSTSLKKKSTPLSDQKNGKGLPPGLGSTPTESRPTPHSSLETYNIVSSRRPGSVYGLRVVF